MRFAVVTGALLAASSLAEIRFATHVVSAANGARGDREASCRPSLLVRQWLPRSTWRPTLPEDARSMRFPSRSFPRCWAHVGTRPSALDAAADVEYVVLDTLRHRVFAVGRRQRNDRDTHPLARLPTGVEAWRGDVVRAAVTEGHHTGRRRSWEILTLLDIAALAGWLRLRDLDLVEFKLDEAIAVDLARRVLDGDFLTVGLRSSVGAYNPPLFVYLTAIPLAVRDDPLAATALVGVLAVAAVSLTYFALRPRFGALVALGAAALFATAPWAVLVRPQALGSERAPGRGRAAPLDPVRGARAPA